MTWSSTVGSQSGWVWLDCFAGLPRAWSGHWTVEKLCLKSIRCEGLMVDDAGLLV